MRYRLTPVALEDIAAIHQKLAEHAVKLAQRAEDAVFKSLDLLARFPSFGRPTDEKEVYRWPMGDFRYTVFFRLKSGSETLEVLRIIDSNRVRDLNRVPW